MTDLHLAQSDEADELLSADPLALLIGMVLDQQIPLEKAFAGPAVLRQRLGTLEVDTIAGLDPDTLARVFVERPAIHRFPAANAKRVQALCRVVVDDYGGDAAAIWTSADTGAELFRRIKALPGFGEQKARIFVALLGKQLGVRPEGWREAAGAYGEEGSRRSVADITDPATLGEVRAYKQQMKRAARAQAATGDG